MRVLLGFVALVCACDSHPRQAREPDPSLGKDDFEGLYIYEPEYGDCRADPPPSCIGGERIVRSWGPISFAAPPVSAYCPVRVRASEAGAVAEAMTFDDVFERAPQQDCVPDKYAMGTRRVLEVDDGYLVSYAGPFDGETFWQDESGNERRFITRARLAGFARAPSGTILALGIGQARLGRGGVVALDRKERGVYVPRLVATMPLEPSPVAFDDGGSLLTFAEGFLVRIDERGKIENVHYFAHDLGRVASITRDATGSIYVGVDCGAIRLAPEAGRFREEWWSAVSGANGGWSGCPASDPEASIVHVRPRVIY